MTNMKYTPCPCCGGETYFNMKNDNFYCVTHRKGCGNEYYRSNIPKVDWNADDELLTKDETKR